MRATGNDIKQCLIFFSVYSAKFAKNLIANITRSIYQLYTAQMEQTLSYLKDLSFENDRNIFFNKSGH